MVQKVREVIGISNLIIIVIINRIQNVAVNV